MPALVVELYASCKPQTAHALCKPQATHNSYIRTDARDVSFIISVRSSTRLIANLHVSLSHRHHNFCSLLPHKCKLSFWVSEWNNGIRARNELYRFRSDIPLILDTSPESFSSEYFTEMLLSYISRPTEVKYGILSNNKRNKLHAVLDCLFFKKLSLTRLEWPIRMASSDSQWTP